MELRGELIVVLREKGIYKKMGVLLLCSLMYGMCKESGRNNAKWGRISQQVLESESRDFTFFPSLLAVKKRGQWGPQPDDPRGLKFFLFQFILPWICLIFSRPCLLFKKHCSRHILVCMHKVDAPTFFAFIVHFERIKGNRLQMVLLQNFQVFSKTKNCPKISAALLFYFHNNKVFIIAVIWRRICF